MLDFIQNTGIPDYDYFASVGKEYGSDVTGFGKAAEKIDMKVEIIKNSINEVSKAIHNIADSATDSASDSSNIVEAVDKVSDIVDNVNAMSEKQEEIASGLQGVVGKFKLK